MTRTRSRLARRALLEGLGLGAIALPFLRPSPARAQADYPTRLLIFTSSNGTVMDEFFPDPGFALKQILAPLEPLKSKMLVMRGIDMESAYKDPVPKDHWPDNLNMLTARQSLENNGFQPTGISIDQHIAASIGNATKFSSLQLGVRVESYCGVVSASGAGQGILPENNPYGAFTRLFADVAGEPGAVTRLRAERRSILDAVQGDINELRCELGSDDRHKIDLHLESIRELERSLDFSAGAGCRPPEQLQGVEVEDEKFPELTKLQTDIAVSALACDLTRVITLQLKNGSSSITYPWLGIPYRHHGIAHGSEGVTAGEDQRREWLIQIERWQAEQFYYLLSSLDQIPEGDGTLLDHTLVLWAHEQSNGGSHSRRDMPYVLAGGRGKIQPGRAVDFGGTPHSGLLMALAHFMGVPTDDFGDPDFSNGPLAGL